MIDSKNRHCEERRKTVIARSGATKQSRKIKFVRYSGLLRCARNDGQKRVPYIVFDTKVEQKVSAFWWALSF